ncbi:hypothetical protein CHCC14820_1996 [Bacillus paralicheniformis]|nr:hypothetical protein CHCC5023_3385 [Bacillus paralicheniformis]TWJ75125.1 hypothetical protein CHCC5019_1796 [Bacillus paralicheniformis]TWM36441.1 hypothetical protein CHCC14820_1996 [Bacillus paralicheniformis]
MYKEQYHTLLLKKKMPFQPDNGKPLSYFNPICIGDFQIKIQRFRLICSYFF